MFQCSLRPLDLIMSVGVLAFVIASPITAEDTPQPPEVGDVAQDFRLPDLKDGTLRSLHQWTSQQPVVLVVLRGYPGYQCPICSRQVGGLIQNSEAIAAAGAHVVLIYPGLKPQLEQRAKEFFSKQTLPDHFTVLTDPDYQFTNAYHLRWDAPRETAYPSTFVISQHNRITYALVSKTHGGRAKPQDVLAALEKLK